MAYVSFPDGILLGGANRDGSNRMQLTYPPLSPIIPRWSPDGKQIIFVDFRGFDHSTTSYIVSADGGKNPEKLMPDNPRLDDPGWSPDGREIVFSERLPVARTEDIRILDLATHKVTTIPGSAGMYSPRWSADGRYIAALARVGPFLRAFNIAAQKWTVLKTTGASWHSPASPATAKPSTSCATASTKKTFAFASRMEQRIGLPI